LGSVFARLFLPHRRASRINTRTLTKSRHFFSHLKISYIESTTETMRASANST
jgi:hypothetical protein